MCPCKRTHPFFFRLAPSRRLPNWGHLYVPMGDGASIFMETIVSQVQPSPLLSRIVLSIFRHTPSLLFIASIFMASWWQMELSSETGEPQPCKSILMFLLVYGTFFLTELFCTTMRNVRRRNCTAPVEWLFETVFKNGRDYPITRICRFPRKLRRFLARTSLHRAWIEGAALGRWLRRQNKTLFILELE